MRSEDQSGPAAASEAYDVVVIGAGAAGLAAAATAAARGLSVAVVESSPFVGGTSAISGGMVWAPGNDKSPQLNDSPDAVRRYLGATVPGDAGREAREAFLARAGEAVAFLERNTAVRLRPVASYPDYYPDTPGATAGGRVLEPVPFDARRLGQAFALLRPPLPEFTLFGGMMVSRADIPHFRKVGRSLKSTLRVARLTAAYALQRLSAPRGTTLYLGNALMAALLRSVLDRKVTLLLATAAVALERDGNGRVCGVTVEKNGARRVVRARRGVCLASGGCSRDDALRAAHLPAAAGRLTATVASGAPAGGVRLALEAGARLAEPAGNNAFWVPASRFRRADGSEAVFPHTVTDRGKPGLIAVDATGRRFVNEALSYHEFVLAMLRAGNRAVPAFLICDKHFLWTYGLGRIRPFALSVQAELDSGYLKTGATIEALAERIGVPPDVLAATVTRFNAHAREGKDPEFGRGGDIYQRHFGDADVKPNPNVAPITAAPFYAVAVHPADLGMSLGLATDAGARVLDASGAAIPGLYACGNDMNSIMNGAYPGPGITLGPAITFGYVAATSLAAA